MRARRRGNVLLCQLIHAATLYRVDQSDNSDHRAVTSSV
jgi:hypothetical protein